MGEAAGSAASLPSVYDAAGVEQKWYRRWLEMGVFRAEVTPERARFAIVIPPPNVTGSLHMGHALDVTLQDILVRWRRMQGYQTLWLPGTDHAGIATQAVVERHLAEEGLSRQALGRERFLERVWAWKEQYEARIIQQLQRLGASCDWSRTRFTLDPGLSRAVEEVFVRYYEQGLIYRGDYMVNWCTRCRTAISDLEVNHEEVDGHLWRIRYPTVDGSGGLTVATTRPETMLGDTAVAVHPDDERYRSLVGGRLRLPLVGREIPVVADAAVDPAFGTGAVKVTPAHDPTDFEIGRRHDLPSVQVIGEDGRMTAEAGPYAGLDRYACREAVVRDLEAQGWLVDVVPHRHAVGHCQRCGSVVEPLVSRQWFLRMQPLAAPAVEAVRDGRVRFVPERFERVYIHWLENVRDWCISRQLWWGHRIPAWECADCGELVVARQKDAPSRCPRCGGERMERDPDVLDTWFSSALWPFSTLGWPEDTPELRYFYPTDVLVTGYDIIFFWVARMIFSALAFTGDVPFRRVLIHGLVRDAQGRKMSKSLGNGVDPLEVVEAYGADALRFALVTGNTPGNDQRFHQEKLEGSRNFGNKIWNAARFTFLQLGDASDLIGAPAPDRGELTLADRWILSRLDRTVEAVTDLLERFELGEAARAAYDFFWDELCDWYLELAKPRLYGREGERARFAARHTLASVMEEVMRLLHPFLPFITEEVWQRLPTAGPTIVTAAWPVPQPQRRDPEAEREMALVMAAVRAVRNLRAEFGVPPSAQARLTVTGAADDLEVLRRNEAALRLLAGLDAVAYEAAASDGEVPGQAATAVVGGAVLTLPLVGLIDIEAERARLRGEVGRMRQEVSRREAKLANVDFTTRAPRDVVERERERLEEARTQLARLEERLVQLGG
ncbi:MAG: valine--tRNA ligase [Clostridia bacterium]|nr:valine--tRNA ligase [Clostridia bacterium]